jgi:hypothetical protein
MHTIRFYTNRNVAWVVLLAIKQRCILHLAGRQNQQTAVRFIRCSGKLPDIDWQSR